MSPYDFGSFYPDIVITDSRGGELVLPRAAVSYAAIRGSDKHLNTHYCFEATQADRRHQCGGQRLIKQRGTFAPVLLTNLSSAKMMAAEA